MAKWMDGWMVGWLVGCARDGLGSHCSFGLASSSSTLLFAQPVCRQIFRVGLALVWATTILQGLLSILFGSTFRFIQNLMELQVQHFRHTKEAAFVMIPSLRS